MNLLLNLFFFIGRKYLVEFDGYGNRQSCESDYIRPLKGQRCMSCKGPVNEAEYECFFCGKPKKRRVLDSVSKKIRPAITVNEMEGEIEKITWGDINVAKTINSN